MTIGVFHDKRVEGILTPQDVTSDIISAEVLVMEEALEREWDSDAHMVCYYCEGSDKFPRIRKQALGWLTQRGERIRTRHLVLDVDNKDHSTWESIGLAKQDDFLSSLVNLPEELINFWALYFTRSGARIIYRLAEPVSPLQAEDHLRWLVSEWSKHGFGPDDPQGADPGCCDWTRMFRLPKVVREGRKSWEQPYYQEVLITGSEIDPGDLGMVDHATHGLTVKRASAVPVDSDMPTPEACHNIMWTESSSGRNKPTDWHRAAKRKLKNRECYPYLFEEQPLAEGKRDSTLTSMIGQAVSLLIILEQATPERIFALFYELLATLTPDTGTPDWFVSAWGKVCRFYSQELAKLEANNLVETEARVEVEKSMGEMIIDGCREWMSAKEHPLVYEDPTTALHYISRRMLANCGSRYFLLSPKGKYETMALSRDQLIPRLRITQMDTFIPTTKVTDSGVSDLSPVGIINKHTTIVREIVGTSGTKVGGEIRGLDGEDATMYMSLYCRNPDLPAEYNEDVDEWLHVLFGDAYDTGSAWIANALAFDEGAICALSIAGDAGAGKKLLVRGLAECLNAPALAGPEDLVGDWGYGLFKSPFLVINEGWPRRSRFAQLPMDAFRRAVSGDGVSACRKSEAPVSIQVPLRVIFTANTLDVVKELAAGKTLSPEDRNAIEDRLIHMDVGSRATHWLESKGGMALTGRRGNRWIMGDSGEPSNYVVAKHFLYLYETRKARPKGRFLMQGSRGSEIMREMRLESGAIPLTAQVILYMLSDYKFDIPIDAPRPPAMQGILVDKASGRVWVVSGGIETYFRVKMLDLFPRENLTTKDISIALRTLAKSFARNARRPVAGARSGRWHEIDMSVLHAVKEQHGWVCEALDSLMEDSQIHEYLLTPERIINGSEA